MTQQPRNLAQSLATLSPKNKVPASARVLDSWITQAQKPLDTAGPRLGWLVAATVVSAVLQRALDNTGAPLFLLKGGTMLQYRLPGMSRTTQDIDGLVRGGMKEFIHALDEGLKEPWGALSFLRTEVETIDIPNRVTKPQRFHVLVLVKGVTWRRVQVEIAADEGRAGSEHDDFDSPSLAGFGLPSPDELVSLSMRYQIAQKIHACTDPHNPPESVNDRARDVVDLLLLQKLLATSGSPTLQEIREAVHDVFTTRAVEAAQLKKSIRVWPAFPVAHQHWRVSYQSAADSASVELTLDEAVEQIGAWLRLIVDAEPTKTSGDGGQSKSLA